MRKGIAIFLLSLVLFTTTEAKQLLKLPFLIEHYLHHKSNDPKTTLIGFLKLHYSKTIIDDDFQEDMKLPFKVHAEFSVSAFTIASPEAIFIDRVYTYVINHTYPMLKESHLNNGLYKNIWQPPRMS